MFDMKPHRSRVSVLGVDVVSVVGAGPVCVATRLVRAAQPVEPT